MAKEKLENFWSTWSDDPSDKNLSKLITASQPVIDKAITSYAGKTDPVVELHAKRLAINAFRKYDPEAPANLTTYLMINMKPLTRVVHKRAQPFKMPRRAWTDLQNVKTQEDQYKQENGVSPSMGELSDLTGLSMSRIERIRQYSKAGVPESVLKSNDPSEFFEPSSAAQTSPQSFWAEAVYSELGPIDQKIMDRRLSWHGVEKKDTKSIAKELGMSSPAVSQRVNKIMARLHEGEAYSG